MNFSLVTFGPVDFGPVTGGQTKSDAYEPTVYSHRWAKKLYIGALGSAKTPSMFPSPTAIRVCVKPLGNNCILSNILDVGEEEQKYWQLHANRTGVPKDHRNAF